MIIIPVPRKTTWHWGVFQPPKASEGEISILWASGRTVHGGHGGTFSMPQQEGFGWEWRIDSTTVPRHGTLSELVQAGRGEEFQYALCGEFECFVAYPEAAVQAAAHDSVIVLTLRSSSLLNRFQQLRPDTVTVSFHAPPLQRIWRRMRIPVEYPVPK